MVENKIWEYKKKKKLKIHEDLEQEEDDIIGQYRKVCKHFDFGYEKDKNPHSCNIVFNIKSDPSKVLIVAARSNFIKSRTITMTDEFTRIKRHRTDEPEIIISREAIKKSLNQSYKKA